MDILKDDYLMDIYKNIELPADEYAFFLPGNVFFALSTANNKNFPWNLKIIKQENKFILYVEIDKENPFLLF